MLLNLKEKILSHCQLGTELLRIACVCKYCFYSVEEGNDTNSTIISKPFIVLPLISIGLGFRRK